MASFSDTIKAWAEKTNRSIEQTVTDTVVDLSNKIVLRTPVGNPELWLYNRGTPESPDYVDYISYLGKPKGYIGGTLRNNWFATIGQPSQKSDRRPNQNAAAALTAIIAESLKAPGNVYYLVNNMPYARRVEYEGWSSQAPAGMLRLTVQEFKAAVERAVAKNKQS